MADAPTRRAVVRHGVVLAGAAWSAPVVRSFRSTRPAGSPPPPTTTTAPPPPTDYEFSGEIPVTIVDWDSFIECPTAAPNRWQFTASLGVLGTAIVEVAFCHGEWDPFFPTVEGGTIEITPPEGAIAGSFTAGTFERVSAGPTDFLIDFTFALTGGTGLYAGAVGSAVFEGTLRPFAAVPTWGFFGTLSGSLTVGG